MIATCPNNPEHKRFITTAHVSQEWLVDETGSFIECLVDCLDITHRPDSGNEWVCADCQDDPEQSAEKPVLAEVSHGS